MSLYVLLISAFASFSITPVAKLKIGLFKVQKSRFVVCLVIVNWCVAHRFMLPQKRCLCSPDFCHDVFVGAVP